MPMLIKHVPKIGGKYDVCEVAGKGEDKLVNGHNVKGVPYVDIYCRDGDYSWNINNYLLGKEYRVSKVEEVQ